MIRLRRLPTRLPFLALYELDVDGQVSTTRQAASTLVRRLGPADGWSVIDEADRLWKSGDRERFAELDTRQRDIPER
jgi:hypothetical protein